MCKSTYEGMLAPSEQLRRCSGHTHINISPNIKNHLSPSLLYNKHGRDVPAAPPDPHLHHQYPSEDVSDCLLTLRRRKALAGHCDLNSNQVQPQAACQLAWQLLWRRNTGPSYLDDCRTHQWEMEQQVMPISFFCISLDNASSLRRTRHIDERSHTRPSAMANKL